MSEEKSLDKRVEELEKFKGKVEWVFGSISFIMICVFIWNYATLNSTVANHETKINAFSKDLRDWELKGFKHPLIGNAFREAKILGIEGMNVAVSVKNQEKVYVVTPSIKSKLLDLKVGSTFSFIPSEDDRQIISIWESGKIGEKPPK
jgi:hypothetical protein